MPGSNSVRRLHTYVTVGELKILAKQVNRVSNKLAHHLGERNEMRPTIGGGDPESKIALLRQLADELDTIADQLEDAEQNE